MRWTPAALQVASIPANSSALTATGFSRRICFLAFASLGTHSACMVVGRGTYTASTLLFESRSS
jgi:hypothetical protein